MPKNLNNLLTKRTRGTLKKEITKFGINFQLDKFVEELFETGEAAIKWRTKPDTMERTKHLRQELRDLLLRNIQILDYISDKDSSSPNKAIYNKISYIKKKLKK